MAERTTIGMSLDEFMAHFEEQPFELINDQIYHLPVEIKCHALVRNELFKTLLYYEDKTKIGEAFSRTLVAIPDEAGYVRNAYYPDVIFIKVGGDIGYDMPILTVPDLVAEVVSPTDKYSDVTTKVDTYLSDCVKLIWIIDPQRKTIAVYEGNDTPKTLRADDTLTGSDVLPNFAVPVEAIFS